MTTCRSLHLIAVFAFASVGAFSNSKMALRLRHLNNMPCFLTTNDGMDLVAASKQLYRPLENVQDGDDDVEEFLDDEPNLVATTEEPSVITAPRGAAIAFVRRLFAQPTTAFHPHKAEGLDSYEGEDGDDVVYFPIVGFTFVRDGPNHCRALPSVSNPSCRIRGDVCDHEHFGTWSVASKN